MLRREMGFPKQYQDHGIRMPLMNLRNLVRSMSISGANLAQVFPRHAIQSINGISMFAGGYQQFVKRGPLIVPVEIETNALAKLVFIDLAPPPFFQNVLMAGKNRF